MKQGERLPLEVRHASFRVLPAAHSGGNAYRTLVTIAQDDGEDKLGMHNAIVTPVGSFCRSFHNPYSASQLEQLHLPRQGCRPPFQQHRSRAYRTAHPLLLRSFCPCFPPPSKILSSRAVQGPANEKDGTRRPRFGFLFHPPPVRNEQKPRTPAALYLPPPDLRCRGC